MVEKKLKKSVDADIIKIISVGTNYNDLIVRQLTNEKDIFDLLNEFDNVFSPPITDRVKNLNNYSKKLYKNAIVYVAENNTEQNLGLVALYANDYNSKIAYIPYIGIKREARNLKIGSSLLQICNHYSLKQGMRYLKLEVQKTNRNAQGFYISNGFTRDGEASEKSWYMIKKLQ